MSSLNFMSRLAFLKCPKDENVKNIICMDFSLKTIIFQNSLKTWPKFPKRFMNLDSISDSRKNHTPGPWLCLSLETFVVQFIFDEKKAGTSINSWWSVIMFLFE